MATKKSHQSYKSPNGQCLFEIDSGPILSSQERDRWQDELGFPLPDIVFGDSSIKMSILDSKGQFRNAFEWNAKKALKCVQKSVPKFLNPAYQSELIELSYANAWRSSRSPDFMKCTLPTYDWTFTSDYLGMASSPKEECQLSPSQFDAEFDKCLLTRRDPILFSDSQVLYEDEMADNGSSIYSVRIRVMPTCFLLLARSFVKIDKVILRSIETRYMGLLGCNDTHYALYRDRAMKEVKWTIEASLFESLNVDEKEWQTIQCDPDSISQKIPTIATERCKLCIPI